MKTKLILLLIKTCCKCVHSKKLIPYDLSFFFGVVLQPNDAQILGVFSKLSFTFTSQLLSEEN